MLQALTTDIRKNHPSPLYETFGHMELSRAAKMKIAEYAVAMRLALHGLAFYTSQSDGDKYDWVVATTTGKLLKLQVRWVKEQGRHGLPVVPLHCYEGHSKKRRLNREEFDFIVGYDWYQDKAYLWSFDEVAHLSTSVTICVEAEERWDKVTKSAGRESNSGD